MCLGCQPTFLSFSFWFKLFLDISLEVGCLKREYMYLKGCLLFINKNYSDFIHSSKIKQIVFGSLRTLLNLLDFRGVHLDLSINNP